MSRSRSPYKRARRAFDNDLLIRTCEMHETEFEDAYGMVRNDTELQREPDNFWLFKDNGADILAVAHLDTVVDHWQRTTRIIDTAGGPVVHSGALDDRLGAHIILNVLPRLNVNVDILLTVGEEQCQSTAEFFDPPKEYNWMIEFDRGGTDVVMYDYEDYECERLVRASGARFGTGSFTDICVLEHLEVKGFNWGVGYHDYHSVRGYAYLEDTWMMIGHFLKFHEANADTYLPHEGRRYARWNRWGWGDDDMVAAHVEAEEIEGLDEDDIEADEYAAQREREWLAEYAETHTKEIEVWSEDNEFDPTTYYRNRRVEDVPDIGLWEGDSEVTTP